MTTLREFIVKRQNEVREAMRALKAEEAELRIALHAIDERAPEAPSRLATKSSRMTIKSKILAVLEDRPDGGTADDVIQWVLEAHGTEVPRSSMSPQLSRLKADGEVALSPTTKNWCLPQFADDAPDDNSEAAASEEAKAEHADSMFGLHDPNHTPTRQ